MGNGCLKCGGSGVIKYYHDAGDHFSAGTSPFSGWEEKPCPSCSSETRSGPVDVIGNARKRGAIDYVNKIKVGENPYDSNDARHWAWLEGFASAGLSRC